jgi:DNA polymerase IV
MLEDSISVTDGAIAELTEEQIDEWRSHAGGSSAVEPELEPEPRRVGENSATGSNAAVTVPTVNWLFVDLNSFFASCEQQEQPKLRNKPVAVVPMMADTTVCIAASYEAKAYGVKTGTIVADAKTMCPDLILVEGQHELYTKIHHKVVEAVESCVPVTAVCSIDEMACRLIGRERPLLSALELGRKVKRTIREEVGEMLRSSVGLAPNRYLAKIASDMEKPDGLVALPVDVLPTALPLLALRDLPGIGARTEKRLNQKGLHTMEQLLALNSEQMGMLWESVWGERLWHWLRGEDFDMADTEYAKSIGHQHVLAPEMRTPEKAWAVALKLLHKAALRLRDANLWAASIGLAVGFAVPRAQQEIPNSVSSYGVPRRGWHGEIRLTECQDNQTLITALRKLWRQQPSGEQHAQPYFVGVHLGGLVPDRLHSLSLFDSMDGAERRARLYAAMDALNHKYGMQTLAPATMLTAFKAAPTRIAFNSVPEFF